MSALETIEASLKQAQSEKVDADVALIEATSRAQAASEAAQRLEAAVAALTGVLSPRPIADPLIEATPLDTQAVPAEGNLPALRMQGEPVAPTPPVTGPVPTDIHDMTPEQFNADRLRKQRIAQKAAIAANPLGQVKCPGCGQAGHLQDTITTAPSGASVRMMVCGNCGNQIIQ